jgi:hypothetical protein
MKEKEVKGLKKLTRNRTKQATFNCDNCKKVRYNKCTCMRKKDKNEHS